MHNHQANVSAQNRHQAFLSSSPWGPHLSFCREARVSKWHKESPQHCLYSQGSLIRAPYHQHFKYQQEVNISHRTNLCLSKFSLGEFKDAFENTMKKTFRCVLQSIDANIQNQKLACGEQNGACLQSQQMKAKVKGTRSSRLALSVWSHPELHETTETHKQTNKQANKIQTAFVY